MITITITITTTISTTTTTTNDNNDNNDTNNKMIPALGHAGVQLAEKVPLLVRHQARQELLLYFTLFCYTVLYYRILDYTMLYHTILYHTVHAWSCHRIWPGMSFRSSAGTGGLASL